jgi:phage tail sheath protein FI
MATAYQTPGVYVEEMPPRSRPIEGVGTSVTAFVGFAERGPRGKPVLVTNWSQYKDRFGEFHDGYYMPHAVYGYFANGGGIAYIVNLAPSQVAGALVPSNAGANGPAIEFNASRKALDLYRPRKGQTPDPGLSVALSYESLEPDPALPPGGDEGGGEGGGRRGGGRGAAPAAPAGEPGLKTPAEAPSGAGPSTPFWLQVRRTVKGEDGTERQVVLDDYGPAVMDRESALFVETLINGKSDYLWVNAPAGKDLPLPKAGTYPLAKPSQAALALTGQKPVTGQDVEGDDRARAGLGGLAAIEDITIVCAPDLMSMKRNGLPDDALRGLQQKIVTHCELMGDRVAILDAPPGKDPQEMIDWREGLGIDSSYAALYYPWIKVLDPTDETGKRLLAVPPCGHIAGIWARTDSERGVHKAPANEVVRGAVDLAAQVTHGEQSLLNPRGVNCIRSFGMRGTRVWGARTLSTDSAWKYINVRRLFNWVEDSIKLGTQWAVFEPNDVRLWQKLKRDVYYFLLRPYRDGALFGSTPAQAFYVKCDTETNPPDQIDAGMVVVEIGICPTKPAEFVVFRIEQLATGGAP